MSDTDVEAATGPGHNSVDVQKLEKIADKVVEILDGQDALRQDMKALVEAGKGLGFDMSAVKKIIALRDPEKRVKYLDQLDAMRLYAGVIGDRDLADGLIGG